MICLGGIQGQVGWDPEQPDLAIGNPAHGRGFKGRKEDWKRKPCSSVEVACLLTLVTSCQGQSQIGGSLATPTLPSGVKQSEHLDLGW